MKTKLEYKGHFGSVEYSREDKLFFRKVMDTDALISYDSANIAELFDNFKCTVNNYLSFIRRTAHEV